MFLPRWSPTSSSRLFYSYGNIGADQAVREAGGGERARPRGRGAEQARGAGRDRGARNSLGEYRACSLAEHRAAQLARLMR